MSSGGVSELAGDTPVEGAVVEMEPAFEDFHRQHRDRLVRTLALHLGDVHLAADAVDHAMGVAWRRWDRLDARGDAAAWVYRVATNWATSLLRRARLWSRRQVPDRLVRDPDPVVNPQLAAALAALPQTFRAVVVLRLVHEWSVDEVATALDIAPGTVKSRLSRGLSRLREDLETQGGRS